MKRNYQPPTMEATFLMIESGLANSSAGMLNFQGSSAIEPEMEDWTNNTTNTSEYSYEKSF